MTLDELFEMPVFINRELPIMDMGESMLFYSVNTIEREFDIIGRKKLNGIENWSILKKDHSFAVLGEVGERRDQTKGLKIIGHVDFKNNIELSWIKDIHVPNKNVLQIDGVQVVSNKKVKGYGYTLYSMLVMAGYIIVSDTTQYVGGKMLWKKIASNAQYDKLKVFIIDNGEVVMQDNQPLNYNGYNYPDELIWSNENSSYNDSKKHVLFVLKKD